MTDFTWVETGTGQSIVGTTVLTVVSATQDSVYTCQVLVDGTTSSSEVRLEVFGESVDYHGFLKY